MPLKTLAKRVVETFGLKHQANLAVLRNYIRSVSEEKLIKEVEDFDNAATLRVLWEAGLSARLQEVVLRRLEKIS